MNAENIYYGKFNKKDKTQLYKIKKNILNGNFPMCVLYLRLRCLIGNMGVDCTFYFKKIPIIYWD